MNLATARSGVQRYGSGVAGYLLFYKNNFIRIINNEAQICPKIKNKLRTIEAWLQMQI